MPSVFSGEQTHKGGFRADQLSLTFGGSPVAGFVLQNLQFQFSQQLSMLFELGSSNVYYVGGRAQGTVGIGRVIGPAPLAADLISQYNDLCNPQDMELAANNGCGDAANPGIDYVLEDAVLQTIQVSMTSEQLVINESLQFMYVDLESSAIN